jgi:hypothetical protein
MAVLDLSEAVSRVRLNVADYNDPVILSDDAIQHSLDSNNGNEGAATKQCAGWILGALSHNSRASLDRITVYSNEVFQQYLVFLKQVVNNPSNSVSGFGGIYVGGMEVSDVLANNSDATLVQRRLPLYPPDCGGEYAVYETNTGF